MEAGTTRLRTGAIGVPLSWKLDCNRRLLAFSLPFAYSGQGAPDHLWSEPLKVEYPGGMDIQASAGRNTGQKFKPLSVFHMCCIPQNNIDI